MATPVEKKEIKLNKEDGGAIKRALDDNAVLYLTETLGLHENTSISNIKLTVGFISVLLALTAQFYPANFPDNWYVLAICCPLYFVCSGILQYVLMFKEKDHILFAKDDFENVVNVRASLPKHDSNYTVTFSDGAKHEESHTKSVGAWIDINGVLREDLYHKDLNEWYSKFAQKNQKKKN